MLKARQSALLAIAAAIAFGLWEAIGHLFLMGLPMSVQHGLSAVISTALALLLAAAVIRLVVGQHRQLQRLAHLRDYLVRMEAHYLRLPVSALTDPTRHFESQRRRVCFLEIQQNFASRSPIVRAKACTEIAALTTDREIPTEEARSLILRATANLSATLYLDREPAVRAEALRSIRTITDHALQLDESLLLSLLKELAHANRAAFLQFQGASAAWCLSSSGSDAWRADDDRLRSFWKVTRLVELEAAGIALARDILQSQEVARLIAAGREGAGRSPGSMEEHALLSELNATATCLLDTRSAITSVLDRLPAPDSLPSDSAGIRRWRADRELSLEGCFLADAEMDGLHLEGADLSRAWLQNATLSGAHLVHANLLEARMRDAQLYSSDLRWARLEGADLTHAGLSTAQMEGANLARANLAGAYLVGVDLTKSVLWKVQVEGMVDGEKARADMTRSNWWEASLRDPLTGSRDKATEAWLTTLYPQPVEEHPETVKRSA